MDSFVFFYLFIWAKESGYRLTVSFVIFEITGIKSSLALCVTSSFYKRSNVVVRLNSQVPLQQ